MAAPISPDVPTMLCPRCWGSRQEPAVFAGGACVACSLCGGAGVTPDQQLSPHFKLSELLHSDTAIAKGISNVPLPAQIEHGRRLCEDLLEPVHALVGPLHSDSGFRSPPLNLARGGAESSAHLDFNADDVKPLTPGVTLKQIVEAVRDSKIPFDQIIFEGSWVHLGVRGPNNVQRRAVLMAFPNRFGKMTYETYDPNDARVRLAA